MEEKIIGISGSSGDVIRSLLQQSPTYFAVIPQITSQIGNWSGVGYAIVDGETGAGKYLLSGGLAGGETDKETDLVDKLARTYCSVKSVWDSAEIAFLLLTIAGCAIPNLFTPESCYAALVISSGIIVSLELVEEVACSL